MGRLLELQGVCNFGAKILMNVNANLLFNYGVEYM